MKLKTAFIIAFSVAATCAVQKLLHLNGRGYLENLEDELDSLRARNKLLQKELADLQQAAGRKQTAGRK